MIGLHPVRNIFSTAVVIGAVSLHEMGDPMNILACDAKSLTLSLVALAIFGEASAQDLVDNKAERIVEEIVVTGSHVQGGNITESLPVTSLNRDDLDTIGATTVEQLIAALPQAGGQPFNGESQGPNSARGDVAGANLRGLGSGNTLVLINGRRVVLHPTTQQEDGVPVQVANLNAIPVAAIRRLDVLRDGAGAIYGADATAGVINHVLIREFDGARVNLRYGTSNGTSLDETSFDFRLGRSFNGGTTNLALFGGYYDRSGMRAADRPYSRTDDRREMAEGPFFGDSQLRNTSGGSPWGGFNLPNPVTIGGTSTSRVHVQPCGEGSLATIDASAGLCLGNGSIGEALRANEAPLKIMTPESDRINLMASATHAFESGTEFFSDLSYYDADSFASRGGSSVLSSAPIVVGADNPFNPFGSGPGRLPGLDPAEVPTSGLGLVTSTYRAFDTGNRTIDVDSRLYRILAGFRGNSGDWSWEMAGLYSEANTKDTEGNRISSSALQTALLRSESSSAYNIFNGGDVANPSLGDTTLNTNLADELRIDVVRDSTATLALADFRVSTPSLFSFLGDDVGAAFGAEWRREESEDDRDPRVDGTITFTNANGDVTSDVVNTSPTPDYEGSRQVFSAYGELVLPLITESDQVPFAKNLDVQLAARYEDFSDIQEQVLKPRVAVSWRLSDEIMLRGSYTEGFRAPNLEQVNATEIRRVQENLTDIQACINQGIIDSVSEFTSCTITSDVEDIRGGSNRLTPEDNETLSFGIVLTLFDDVLTLTADYWGLEQADLVGLISAREQMDLDAVLREQGSSNPNVIRDSVTSQAVQVQNQFLNLAGRDIEGVDYSVIVNLDTENAGRFRINAGVSTLMKYDQASSPVAQVLVAAGLPAASGGTLLKRNDNPYTRATAGLHWNSPGNGSWGASLFARYVGSVVDTSVTATVDGETQFLPVDEYLQVNLSADYTFFDEGPLENTTIRVGMNNLFDEAPPLADETFGFADNLHTNRQRNWFIQLSKDFE